MGGILAEPTCPSGFCPETCQSFVHSSKDFGIVPVLPVGQLFSCSVRHALKKKKADGGLLTLFGQSSISKRQLPKGRLHL